MDTVPAPIESVVSEEHSPRKISRLLIAVVVLVAVAAGIAIYAKYVPLSVLNGGSIGKQTLSPATVVAYFPNFSDIRGVTPDPTDSHLFWVFTYAGVIMQIHTETKEIIDHSQRIHETDITDLVRVGDTLFIALQGGGVRQYDLTTGTTKRYTESDGLTSNNNVYITPDPSDADVLWIGTFYGLNKLSISSGKIDRFQTEMGIPSSAPQTSLQPAVFHVDDHYVWVSINANAFTAGGIARLDKKTGVWKSWGYDYFSSALKKSRFDTYGAAADGERAIVEESHILYTYDATQDKWVQFVEFKPEGPLNTYFSLKGNHAYYFSDVPKVLDLDTGIERNLLTPALSANSGISAEALGKILPNMRMEFDQPRDRMLLYPQPSKGGSPDELIAIVPLSGAGSMSSFSFSELEKKFGLINANLADTKGTHVLLDAKNSLMEYDTIKGSIRTLLPYSVTAAKIVGNKVVALNLAQCDMGCSESNLVATSSVVSLDTGAIDFVTTIRKIAVSLYHIGTTLDEIYLFKDNYVSTPAGSHYEPTGYKLNTAKKSLDDIGTAFPHAFIPDASATHIVAESPDGAYSISYDKVQLEDTITLKVQHGSTASTTVNIPVTAPLRTSPFEPHSPDKPQITSYAFDSSHATIVWIGTDRGLIRLDMSTLAYTLFTTDSGLLNNRINTIAVTTHILIEYPDGLYVYRY